MSDKKNPNYIFSMTDTSLLLQAIRGEIDLNTLAKEELANRGLDGNGVWVGFARAKEIHLV